MSGRRKSISTEQIRDVIAAADAAIKLWRDIVADSPADLEDLIGPDGAAVMERWVRTSGRWRGRSMG